ncbi:MAG: hypothetical protein JW943_09170 [Deltaproteobacteria bacterium]|nr:hypothetical protein [Deltaproteobacteria bacterium]
MAIHTERPYTRRPVIFLLEKGKNMTLSNPLTIVVMLFALFGVIFLIMAIIALKKRKLFGTSVNFVIALLMLSLSALFGTLSIAIQGYHALTREELATIVKVQPVGEQKFMARFTMPDGSVKVFSIAGDQLYVDAHILKWKPLANIFGLHTSYELDRVAGRYADLDDEKTKVRTVYTLSKDRPLDIVKLRRRYAILKPLLDAEYGSATFINTNSTEEFRVMVSTTGLLIRKTGKENSQ